VKGREEEIRSEDEGERGEEGKGGGVREEERWRSTLGMLLNMLIGDV